MANDNYFSNGNSLVYTKEGFIAGFAVIAIVVHLFLRFLIISTTQIYGFSLLDLPLLLTLIAGGGVLVFDLSLGVLKLEFTADLLAGISIVTSVLLGEYLAGTLVVLMLSGGQTLESYAVRNASSVLQALARRMPSIAHRKSNGNVKDIKLDDVSIGEQLVVFPHEICPVDGTVVEGHGSMDESYLTGEPYIMSKIPGAGVLSGAINGEKALTIRADKLPVESRYSKIMQVMRESEQRRPRLRRLGDQLGSYYTPFAVALAIMAWIWSGESLRFLAVLVVATPCPLLIAIPVSIIGSVSLAARRGIIIKDPAILEKIKTCRTAMFDKTGTLTYGKPRLTEIQTAPAFSREEILLLVASLETYSRHPLSSAITEAANESGIQLYEAKEVSERPGEGLKGTVNGKNIQITGRKKLERKNPGLLNSIPDGKGGLECVILVDGEYGATLRFRDEPRTEGLRFIKHLESRHGFKRVMLVSGDRESEVKYLADKVGITEIYSSQSPEQKLKLVRDETRIADTIFLGDGINDAPALTAATVGIAFGQSSDIITEAAGAVILESSLQRVDELLHIGGHMRSIALQSAVGGMALSVIAMLFAASGYLPPVAGAVTQEIIDIFAVVNALRVAVKPKTLTDY